MRAQQDPGTLRAISMVIMTGLYVGKIFEQVKGRPLYVVDPTLGPVIAEEVVEAGAFPARQPAPPGGGA